MVLFWISCVTISLEFYKLLADSFGIYAIVTVEDFSNSQNMDDLTNSIIVKTLLKKEIREDT